MALILFNRKQLLCGKKLDNWSKNVQVLKEVAFLRDLKLKITGL